jgi:hypothetical protein
MTLTARQNRRIVLGVSALVIVAGLGLVARAQERFEDPAQSGNALLRALKDKDNFFANGYAKGYINGFVDMLESADIVCVPDGVTNGQIYDVVQQHLEQNPAARHRRGSNLIVSAVGTVFTCKK